MNDQCMTDDNLRDDSPRALQQEIERYQRFSRGSGYGFWEWCLDTQKVVLIGELWGQLGYSAEAIAELSDAKKMAVLVHPEDRRGVRFNLRSQLKYDLPLILECRLRTHSGSYVWVQVRANSLCGDDGRVKLISGIVFDITALKRAEEALLDSQARQERIIAASNDGIWEWQAGDSGIHFSSRCWEHIGYSDDDDAINQGENRWQVWRSFMHPQDLPSFDRALARHHKYHEPFDIEYRINTKEGDTRWIRARGKASYDSNGAPMRMSGTNMDITSLKRAEERVMLAKEAAEEANQAKSDFLSSMSHELRTPLNAILGFAQLFDYDGSLNNEQQQNVQEIRKAGQHLLKLIGDVLDLSKVEAGRMALSLEPVLASRALQECLALVQPLAEIKGVRIDFSLETFESAYIQADVIRFKQALLNLISNGVKYNRRGGEVFIRFLPWQNSAGACLRMEIRDNGLGIALHKQAEMFQPFNRLGAEGSGIEGSGVGLVITKRLIEMMEGQISFDSVENVGTTFWLDMPLAAEVTAAPRVETVVTKPLERAQSLSVTGCYRVLYIEDNPSNIRLMQQIFDRFEQLTLEVEEESFQGLYRARTTSPDIIILDINLPGLSGFEVLKVLQEDVSSRDIPVLGLSANAMPRDIDRGLDAGFAEYLTKPVELDRLVSALNKYLD